MEFEDLITSEWATACEACDRYFTTATTESLQLALARSQRFSDWLDCLWQTATHTGNVALQEGALALRQLWVYRHDVVYRHAVAQFLSRRESA